MKVGLVENGVVTKDVTDRLSSGEVNFNLINLKGEVLRVINKTPKVKVDYGFSDSPDGDAYKSPIGRASFNEGQLRAHLNEIRRFDRADGGHSWDEVSDFIKIVSKTAEGLRTYKDECGTETERRYARAFPRYLYNSQQLSAGGFVEVAEGCKTDVIFTSMHYVEAPKPTEPQPDRTPVPVIPAPVQAPVQAPPKPAPAQLPGEVR